MNAVDTNVLIYVHDHRDLRKQQAAAALVTSLANPVLLWQVACEYIAAGRKLKAVGVSEDEIWTNLRLLQSLWPLVLPQWQHLIRAESLVRRHSLSFWDALLVAAAIESGIGTIYSEDLASIGPIEGIRIINPFSL